VTWALFSALGGEVHTDDLPELFEKLKSREITPGAFFMSACDGKFTDEDLNDERNAFAEDFYAMEKGTYAHHCQETLADDLASLYHVSDTWDNFNRLTRFTTGGSLSGGRRILSRSEWQNHEGGDRCPDAVNGLHSMRLQAVLV
jgi:hypothetical protein